MIWAIFAVLTLATVAVLTEPLWRVPAGERRPAWFALAAMAVLLPVGAGLVYAGVGAPQVPGAAYRDRLRDPDFALQSEALNLSQRLEQRPSAAGFARLGEILVDLNGGRVTPAAGEAFSKALQMEPARPDARYFAGLAIAQHGEKQKALAVWRALEKDSSPNAPWLAVLRKSIADLEAAGD